MAQRHHIRQLFVAALALGLVAGCDDLGNGDDGGTGGDSTIQPDAGPPPQGIEFKKAGETAEADFATGSEEFLVVPYSTSETASSAINYDIKVTSAAPGSEASTSYKLRLPPRLPLRVRNPLLWARWQQRLTVERWTRGLMEQAAKLKLSGPSRPMDKTLAACTTSADCGATEVCDNTGNCAASLKIKVGQFASTATEIDVDVKKKGTIAAVLVDQSDTSVAQAAIDAMLTKFEQEIYPCNKKLFGDPVLKSGGTILASDRNADGLIWIVLTSKVQDKSAVGFFVATDFVDKATEPKSNEADILYVDSAQTGDKAFTTLAHELQHLLGFAVKKYKPEQNSGTGALEALWLDEGQSHFAEDACGYGGENVTLLDQEVFPSFSDTATFETATDGLAMRGMAMLFIRYLFEQKGGDSGGGPAFLAKLHEESKQGTEAIRTVYGDLQAAFGNWVAAVALDGRAGHGITDKRYRYDDLTTHPTTGNKVGVKIRGTRKDETGADVALAGPLDEDLTGDTSDSVANATAKFFLLKGKSGKVSVSVSSQDSSIAFALIKIK
jgi:hypothetical protein